MTTSPRRRIDLRTVAVTALVSGLGSTAIAVVAGIISAPKNQVTVDIVLRSLMVAVLLALVLPSVLDRQPRIPATALYPSVLAGATVGYLINPYSWSGRTFVTQLVLDAGPATAVADLMLWLGLVALACTRVAADDRAPVSTPNSYTAT
jgi:hypothetical protein